MQRADINRLFLVLAAGAITGSGGCMDVNFDSSSVRPTAVAPASTAVEAVNVPFDANLPKYVVAVEPVQFAGQLTERYTLIQGTAAGESREQSRNAVAASGNGTVASDTAAQVGGTLDLGRGGSNHNNPLTPAALVSNPGAPGTITAGAGVTNRNASKSDAKYAATVSGSTNRTGSSESERSVYESVRVTTPDKQAIQIAAQLTSALSGVENLSLRDLSVIRRTRDGQLRTPMRSGEVGPFLVRALVTEYTPEADIEKLKVHVLPGTKFVHDKKVGVVVLDVSIIDGRDGHVVTSFPAAGTFQWQKKASDIGLIFSVYSADKQAKSVMDNALRAALNDAAGKTLAQLSQRVR